MQNSKFKFTPQDRELLNKSYLYYDDAQEIAEDVRRQGYITLLEREILLAEYHMAMDRRPVVS
jgi:hypothetical protein